RLLVRSVDALDSGSKREDPDLEGRVKLDAAGALWRVHSDLEGGWDGTVRRPARDASLFKSWDRVYQSNTPYLEFKELYVTHSWGGLDIRAGIQRFAWGRLDEYPPNDLLNPWDYTRFLEKPLEDRKIGVPSLSATLTRPDWAYEAVWVPVFIPYRLPLPDERWAGTSLVSAIAQAVPNAEIRPQEPDLPERRVENSSFGVRVRRTGEIEWALNLFHGYDTRPVFRTTELAIIPGAGNVVIDPGYVPDFHRISVIGADVAAVRGDVSLRAEIALSFHRFLNVQRPLWGYPASPAPGVYALNPIEQKRDTADYGVGADYRLFEDGLLTVQAQQTVILGNTDQFYEKKRETILWLNLKAGFLNQKIETNVNVALNPEHGDTMAKANAWYVLTDAWKAGVTAMNLDGPPQSIFGRYSRNDQVEAEVVYSW
ncbi:MAG TPA: DUF1302 family protein, partial [Nitrospirota bacterium]|nr:DUF1302 family protein [Nitrospirota bacterium]